MLHRRLAALEKQGKPIRVGLVGCGRMGVGVINQIYQTRGMRLVAVADKQLDRAQSAAAVNLPPGAPPCVTNDRDAAARAVELGQVVVSTDSRMVCDLPLDVIVESTGVPESGARVAY